MHGLFSMCTDAQSAVTKPREKTTCRKSHFKTDGPRGNVKDKKKERGVAAVDTNKSEKTIPRIFFFCRESKNQGT